MRFNRISIAVLCAIIITIIIVLNFKNVGRKPELLGLSDSVASPGDIITLKGNYFGGEITRGRVYINGKMVYKDFIKSWDSKEITLVLEDDFSSGMVTVSNMFGESRPFLITSFNDVPMIENPGELTGVPFIETASFVDRANLKIKLTGRNLGELNDDSTIYVSELGGTRIVLDVNSVKEWNDDEVILYLPFGMNNIILTLNNNHGSSNEITLHNSNTPVVIYNYDDRKNYNLSQNVQIDGVVALGDSYIHLFYPTVYNGYNQRVFKRESESGEYNPITGTYDNTIELDSTGLVYDGTLNTSIEVSSVSITLRDELAESSYDKESIHYLFGFEDIPDVELGKDLKNTAVWLVRNSRDRLTQVEILLNWILRYIDVDEDGPSNSTTGFAGREVSEIGLVNLTTSMLRSVGIPSVVVSGIKESENGWINYRWLEFFIPDGGWVAIDVIENSNNPEYVIGTVKNSMIAFTKGYNVLEYEETNAAEDFYALQNSIDSAEGNIVSYTSVWHNVIVN